MIYYYEAVFPTTVEPACALFACRRGFYTEDDQNIDKLHATLKPISGFIKECILPNTSVWDIELMPAAITLSSCIPIFRVLTVIRESKFLEVDPKYIEMIKKSDCLEITVRILNMENTEIVLRKRGIAQNFIDVY